MVLRKLYDKMADSKKEVYGELEDFGEHIQNFTDFLQKQKTTETVSYTHLTLPTILRV